MNKEQLAAQRAENVRQSARRHPHGLPSPEMLDGEGRCRWCQDTTALAYVRLELQQAKDSRDDTRAKLTFEEACCAQQREDIQRILVTVEAVCAKACLTGRKGEDGWTYQVGRDGDAALRALAGVRDEFAVKYPKGDENA